MIRLNHVSKIYGDGSKSVDDLFWDIEMERSPDFSIPLGRCQDAGDHF